MRLVHHPSLPSMAKQLRDLATIIEQSGQHDGRANPCRCVLCVAHLLSARGWPNAVGSDGMPTAPSASSSSTERAAINPNPKAFVGIDERIAKTLRLLWLAGLNLQADVHNVLARGDDADLLPAGSGECPRCGHYCRPDRKYADRIKSGLCPSCYQTWYRLGRPDRSMFIAQKDVA